MIRMLFSAALAGALVIAAQPILATESGSQGLPDPQAFLGIWEGIDPLDGSTVRMVITDVGGGPALELSQTESFFTNCVGLGPNYSQGHGFIGGHGRPAFKRVRVGDTNTVRKVLAVETRFVCIDNKGQPRAPLTGKFDYPLVQGGRVLVIPGVPAGAPDILLYRTGR
jgi:hypothetical protein